MSLADDTVDALDEPPRPLAAPAWVELLVTGGGTLVVFPLLLLLRRAVGLDGAELAVGFLTFHAALVVNDPHFAVTYLLFYRDARKKALHGPQRARWLFAGLVAPIALLAWAVYAILVGSARTLGWEVELMFLLVGWPYVKQGFGVLTVLSVRRGIFFAPRERLAVLAHAFAAWAYAWASPAQASTDVEEKGVVYATWPRPVWLEQATFAAFALTAAVLVVVLGAKAWREKRLPWAPLTGFFVAAWWWTIWPGKDPLMAYVVPALHSIQYGYFVWLLRGNEARRAEGPPTFGRPLAVRLAVLFLSAVALGWVLLHGVPGALDAWLSPKKPTLAGAWMGLGATPWLAAFFVVVNVHHYFMDNVIWRRENPETTYLRA